METREALFNKSQTGQRMKMLISRYARDLDKITIRRGNKDKPLSQLSALDIHTVVKNIPYKKDTAPVEVIGRPARLLNGEFSRGIDCKKKAILLSAWAVRNNIPYRLIASSRRPDKKFHHVFPQIALRGEWINFDATYKHMKMGGDKTGTAFEVL